MFNVILNGIRSLKYRIVFLVYCGRSLIKLVSIPQEGLIKLVSIPQEGLIKLVSIPQDGLIKLVSMLVFSV